MTSPSVTDSGQSDNRRYAVLLDVGFINRARRLGNVTLLRP